MRPDSIIFNGIDKTGTKYRSQTDHTKLYHAGNWCNTVLDYNAKQGINADR